MNLVSILGFFFLGGVTGLISGYLGIGGGVILVPILTALLSHQGLGIERTMTSAFATSLFTAIFTTGAAAFQQYRQQNLILKVVPWTAGGAVVGGQIGSWLGSNLPGATLRTSFVIFLLLAAVYLIGDWKPTNEDETKLRFNRVVLVTLGLVTGVLSGLFGIGGGIVMVPAFIFLLSFPIGKVSGTSSAIAFLLSISGVVGYLLYGGSRAGVEAGFVGVIDVAVAIPIIAGSLITAMTGARLNKKYGGTVYRKVFGVFLIIIAVRMFLTGRH